MSTKAMGGLAMVLWVAVLVSGLSVAHAKYAARQHFSELQSLHRERDALEIEWGRLTIEQGTWATHGRVERLARERGLRIPAAEDIVIVER